MLVQPAQEPSPRQARLSRTLKDLCSHLKPVKSLQILVNAEKAGVGGSTPSLATIIPKHLRQTGNFPSVRSQSAIFSARFGSIPGYVDGEGLRLDCQILSPLSVRFQSAFVRAVAENRSQHCHMPSLSSVNETASKLSPHRSELYGP
jgi:hypothetical protein